MTTTMHIIPVLLPAFAAPLTAEAQQPGRQRVLRLMRAAKLLVFRPRFRHRAEL